MNDFEPFHSAVNRIPVLRDSGERLANRGVLPRELFTDHPAPGHDHLAPERWSGSIDLEMTVRTPLVFGEQKGGTVSLPADSHGQPVVPPTMVKGMISRAYEALTCSRFRIFGYSPEEEAGRQPDRPHSGPLTYRGDAASALGLVPVRVSETDDEGLIGELFYGDTRVMNDYHEGSIVYPTMYAAALQAGNAGHAEPRAGTSALERLFPHGKEVRCHLSLCLHGDRGKGARKEARYAYWQVTHVRDGESFREVFRIKDSVTIVDTMEDVAGYVCRTTPDGKRPRDVFPRKHDERFFFDVSPQGPHRVRITREVSQAYATVVQSYVHQWDNDPRAGSRTPNRATHSALQGGQEDEGGSSKARLEVGDLAFAVVDESSGQPVVREVVPTMIGRRAYGNSPYTLAATQRVLPLSGAREASAADRLFGYVVPSATEDARGGDVAARGRLAFGVVDTSRARISREAKTLSPLLAPKLGSARRFLTDQEGRTPRTWNSETGKQGQLKREGYFSSNHHLGAAAYPVHRKILGQTTFPTEATAAPTLAGRDQSNTDVRLTARSWLKAGSILTCTISFTSLSKEELAALIWVLVPENLVPEPERQEGQNSPDTVGYLRMGLGKPLGLGVVEVRIAEGGFHARRGDGLAEGYMVLTGCLGEDDTSRADDASLATNDPGSFTLPNEDKLLKTPWVQAMQRAAFGYADNVEVRYMTLEENRANNQINAHTGEPAEGAGIAPRDMFGHDAATPLRISTGRSRAQPRRHSPRSHHGRTGRR
ncbi:hypothetical protein [Actinomyces wuliandei]|uniref:hypothetical protein n=1 Tax=Actinomyces wuliandei TaxID=2057743 RepID=UPI001118A1A5|nr:hypothetical protein [Actinomyces wuliandei]